MFILWQSRNPKFNRTAMFSYGCQAMIVGVTGLANRQLVLLGWLPMWPPVSHTTLEHAPVCDHPENGKWVQRMERWTWSTPKKKKSILRETDISHMTEIYQFYLLTSNSSYCWEPKCLTGPFLTSQQMCFQSQCNQINRLSLSASGVSSSGFDLYTHDWLSQRFTARPLWSPPAVYLDAEPGSSTKPAGHTTGLASGSADVPTAPTLAGRCPAGWSCVSDGPLWTGESPAHIFHLKWCPWYLNQSINSDVSAWLDQRLGSDPQTRHVMRESSACNEEYDATL